MLHAPLVSLGSKVRTIRQRGENSRMTSTAWRACADFGPGCCCEVARHQRFVARDTRREPSTSQLLSRQLSARERLSSRGSRVDSTREAAKGRTGAVHETTSSDMGCIRSLWHCRFFPKYPRAGAAVALSHPSLYSIAAPVSASIIRSCATAFMAF